MAAPFFAEWTEDMMPAEKPSAGLPDDDDDDDRDGVLGAPFMAIRAMVVALVRLAAPLLLVPRRDDDDDKDEPVLPPPLGAFEAIVKLLQWAAAPSGDDAHEDDDDDGVEAAHFGVAFVARRLAGVVEREAPCKIHELSDEDAAIAPWLGFAWLARSLAPDSRLDDDDDDEPSSFAYPAVSVDQDDVAATTAHRAFDFVLRILRFMAAPFSPSRAPPAFIKRTPSNSNLKDSNEDLASLAGVRLFAGSKRRSNAQVRLRNTL